MHKLLLVLPVLMLAACDKAGDSKGTDISLKDSTGNVVASADGDTGKVAVNLPGFRASVDLPKMDLNAEELDIDGVKLYPGSKVAGMNIRDGGDGEKDSVDIRFTAPATPDKVRSYFLDAFKDKGAGVTADGAALVGKNADGSDVRIDLAAAGAGTTGMIRLTSKD